MEGGLKITVSLPLIAEDQLIGADLTTIHSSHLCLPGEESTASRHRSAFYKGQAWPSKGLLLGAI